MGNENFGNRAQAKAELDRLNDLISHEEDIRKEAEDAFLALQISNAQKIYNLKISLANKAAEKEEQITTAVAAREAIERQKAVDKKINAERKKAKNKKLDPERIKQLTAEAIKEFTVKDEVKQKWEKAARKKQKRENKLEREQELAESNAAAKKIFGKGASFEERIEGFRKAFTDKDGSTNILKGLTSLTAAFGDIATQLNGTIEKIAGSKTAIDTRLQGWGGKTKSGSYWDQISSDINAFVGASPLVKQEDVVTNLKSMVGQGIAFNVEQRAFLQTIKTTIADTFDATNETLTKLVRIQQADSTAARLGMESALTSFLNNMYETTEYMQSAAKDIKAQIYEASALMSATNATEFEYQVQKWMGSLYSVGFNSTSGLAGALGKLAAGDISGISQGGYGNLLVMAANKANLSIADVLANGLDESETNTLMKAMVEYLGQIYSETKGSNVLAQQYAGVFGLTASDLKAAANLAGSTGSIYKNNLSYGGMLGQLTNMANTMSQRTSAGQMMSNAWSNLQYSVSAGIANSQALYGIYKVASLLDAVAGGVNIPLYSPMGSLNTNLNLSDIMQTGVLGTSFLSGIGSMLGGLFSSGSGLLDKFGVTGNATVSRGTGQSFINTNGASTSQSGYVGNSNSSDVYNQAMTSTSDSMNQQISASEEESTKATTTDINNNVVEIYNLLKSVISGSESVSVSLKSDSPWFSNSGLL